MGFGSGGLGIDQSFKADRFIKTYYYYNANVQTQALNQYRVALAAFAVPRLLSIDQMSVNPYSASPAGNWRMCIYRDNGDTPKGGQLLYNSGPFATPASNPAAPVSISPSLLLSPGQYWAGIQTDISAGAQYSAAIMTNYLLLGPFNGCYYDPSPSIFNLTNPCPAVTTDILHCPEATFRVATSY